MFRFKMFAKKFTFTIQSKKVFLHVQKKELYSRARTKNFLPFFLFLDLFYIDILRISINVYDPQRDATLSNL